MSTDCPRTFPVGAVAQVADVGNDGPLVCLADELEVQQLSNVRCHRGEVVFVPSVGRLINNNFVENDRDILSGSIKCADCGTENSFRLRGRVIEYRHDPNMFGQLS